MKQNLMTQNPITFNRLGMPLISLVHRSDYERRGALVKIYRRSEGNIAVTIIALFAQVLDQQNEESVDFDKEE